MRTIRVELPFHLRTLAGVAGHECELTVRDGATTADVLDALEQRFPEVRGTVRDPLTGERRPYLRFFACQQDLSFEPLTAELPRAVLAGREPFIILGAISGG